MSTVIIDKPLVDTMSIKHDFSQNPHTDKAASLSTKVTQQNHKIKTQSSTHFEGELVFIFVCKSPS